MKVYDVNLEPTEVATALGTRVFSPKFGYLEDPATGSGNSAFAYYLLMNNYWEGKPIAIEQGSNMIYNTVRLRAENDEVLFGGTATVKISGKYYP